MIANIDVIIVSFILGILIKFFRAYFLIAGYNIMPAKYKKSVDIKGLANHLGYGLIAGSGLLLIGGIAEKYGVLHAASGSLILYFILLAYLVIKAQSYTSPQK